MSVTDEFGSEGLDEEDLLEEVEGDVWDGEELAGVRGGETDVGDGVGREVVGTEGEELGLRRWMDQFDGRDDDGDGEMGWEKRGKRTYRPAAKNDAFVPRFGGVRRDGMDGFGN